MGVPSGAALPLAVNRPGAIRVGAGFMGAIVGTGAQRSGCGTDAERRVEVL